CDFTYVGVGQVCTLAVKQVDPAGVLPVKLFHIRINFLSFGSVFSFTVYIPELAVNIANFTNINNTDLVVRSLTYGGYLMIHTYLNGTKQNILGFLFDETTGRYDRWVFQEPEPTSYFPVYTILHNNTLLL